MQHFSYLQIAMAAVASYGIQLIEPYNCKIKNKETTHTSLIEFYTNLNAALDKELDMTFFSFDTVPSFPFEAKNISYVIKHTYTEEVVTNVKKLANQDCLNLVNHIRPALQTVIASQ